MHKLPDTPESGGLTLKIPSFNNNNPEQAVPEDGRWPPETQNPYTSESSAPIAQDPDTLKDPVPNQQPEINSCTINGRKLTACTPSENKWNALTVQSVQTENRFSIAGRAAIARLDNVKTDTKIVPTDETMNLRYIIDRRPISDAGRPSILRVVKNIDRVNDRSW